MIDLVVVAEAVVVVLVGFGTGDSIVAGLSFYKV